MKKTFGGSLVALLVLMILPGCSESAERNEPVRAPKLAPKITVVTEPADRNIERAKPDLTATNEAPNEGSCKVDSDCTVVPTDIQSCAPCHGQNGQRAISIGAARELMAAVKSTCMPVIDKLKKGEIQFQKSSHESCQFNAANCVQGMCTLVTLTEQELKARHPEAGGARQQSPGAGMAPQGNSLQPGFDPRAAQDPRNMGRLQNGFGSENIFDPRRHNNGFDPTSLRGPQIGSGYRSNFDADVGHTPWGGGRSVGENFQSRELSYAPGYGHRQEYPGNIPSGFSNR